MKQIDFLKNKPDHIICMIYRKLVMTMPVFINMLRKINHKCTAIINLIKPSRQIMEYNIEKRYRDNNKKEKGCHVWLFMKLLFFVQIFSLSIWGMGNDSIISCKTTDMSIDFSLTGAYPLSWKVFYTSILGNRIAASITDSNDPIQLRIISKDNEKLTKEMQSLTYQLRKGENNQSHIFKFTSTSFGQGYFIEKTYEIAKQDYRVSLRIRILGSGAEGFIGKNNLGITLSSGRDFNPLHAAGFAAGYEKVTVIGVHGKDIHSLVADSQYQFFSIPENQHRYGFRNRFWAILGNLVGDSILVTTQETPLTKTLQIFPATNMKELEINFYTGPLSYYQLQSHEPSFTRLIFNGLWFWMRWLGWGLLFILNFLISLTHNYGIAIITLSLVVKLFMLPLTRVADKWQREVNEKKSRLAPHISKIKAESKGEEQNKRILELYKEQNIHPLFSLKSVFGLLVQIPIFFAAYHMLQENIVLKGAQFLWIKDLSLPDSILTLPFTIPFFGDNLNLLPFLMTLLTILASWKFDDGSLAPALLKRQRLNLYVMALLFFILFYTFPSGMVLYWTTNNFTALIKAHGKSIWGKMIQYGTLLKNELIKRDNKK